MKGLVTEDAGVVDDDVDAPEMVEAAASAACSRKPRYHYDNFPMAFITVFQVMTTDNWPWLMYETYNASGYFALFFFPAVIIIGNIIVLNLFLAILLANFSGDDDAAEMRSGDAACSCFAASIIASIETRSWIVSAGCICVLRCAAATTVISIVLVMPPPPWPVAWITPLLRTTTSPAGDVPSMTPSVMALTILPVDILLKLLARGAFGTEPL